MSTTRNFIQRKDKQLQYVHVPVCYVCNSYICNIFPVYIMVEINGTRNLHDEAFENI